MRRVRDTAQQKVNFHAHDGEEAPRVSLAAVAGFGSLEATRSHDIKRGDTFSTG